MPALIADFWNTVSTPPIANYIALGASIVAFLISILATMQKVSEYRLAIRKQLTDYISKLHELNIEQAKSNAPSKRDDYPEGFDRLVTDQRRFLSRQAEYLARKIGRLVTPCELMVIAISLDQIDDLTLAELYFQKALRKKLDRFELVIVLRQFARFLFRNGRLDEGRKSFAKAVSMASGSTRRHLVTLGDTYERWGLVEADFGDRSECVPLLESAEAAYSEVEHSGVRNSLLQRLNKIRRDMGINPTNGGDKKSVEVIQPR